MKPEHQHQEKTPTAESQALTGEISERALDPTQKKQSPEAKEAAKRAAAAWRNDILEWYNKTDRISLYTQVPNIFARINDLLKDAETKAAMVDKDPGLKLRTKGINIYEQEFEDGGYIPPKGKRSRRPRLDCRTIQKMFWMTRNSDPTGKPAVLALVQYPEIKAQAPKPYLSEIRAQAELDRAIKEWKETGHEQLITTLFSTPSVRVWHKTTKFVAFGMGEICADDPDRGTQIWDRSRIQTAVFRKIGEALQEYMDQNFPGEKVELIAQDPAYESPDKEKLREMGIRAIDHPIGAVPELDDETAVFSIAASFPVRQIVFTYRLPSVIIWTEASENARAPPEAEKWNLDGKALKSEDMYEPPFPSPPPILLLK